MKEKKKNLKGRNRDGKIEIKKIRGMKYKRKMKEIRNLTNQKTKKINEIKKKIRESGGERHIKKERKDK